MLATSNSLSVLPQLASETVSRLEQYVEQLLKWNAKINLISSTTVEDVWRRHIEDSLQLLPLLPPTAMTLADLGSGAGLPGMVIAIAKPDISVTLIEKDQRKSAFLNEVKSRLKLHNVSIVTADIESQASRYDSVCARALAPLDQLLGFASKLIVPNGQAIFLKGENYAEEISAAKKTWSFDVALTQSVTHRASSILTVTNLTKKVAP